MKKAFILGGTTLALPLFAEDGSSVSSITESFDALGLGIDLKSIILFFAIFMILGLVIALLFLRSISLFAKSMKLSNSLKETSGVWIWTQLVPLWSYIATFVMLIKLNKQYKAYVLENSSLQIRTYNSILGWIWYISSILFIVFSIFNEPTLELKAFYLFGIILNFVFIASFVGFWVHISEVRKSIEANIKI